MDLSRGRVYPAAVASLPSSPAGHVVAEPCGVPSPKTATRTLDDGTVLLPRCRHTTHQAHVLTFDAHIIGRAYDLWVRSSGPWRRVHPSPGAVSVFPAGFETWWDIPVANDFAGVVLSDERLRVFSDELGSGRRIDLAERILVDDPTTGRIVDLVTAGLEANDRSARLFFERGIDLLCAQLARVHPPTESAAAQARSAASFKAAPAPVLTTSP